MSERQRATQEQAELASEPSAQRAGELDLDLDRVRREIDDEVRARKASGDLPPGLERELDLVFARFSPAATSGDDLAAVLEAAERASFIDVDVPTASNTPGIAPVKRGLRKLQSWYLRYLAQQVSAFGASVTTALRLLGRRVEALEAATPAASAALRDEARSATGQAAAGPHDERAVAWLAGGPTGRVAVVESGDASLLRRLVDAGADGYGVDPSPGAGAPGLEVRDDDPLEHLRSVAEAALAGLVLVGGVDRLPLGEQVELADRAGAVLADGGRVALLGTPPEAWARLDVVRADLSPGRPLHAATWAHLLGRRGFHPVDVEEAEDAFLVTGTRAR